MYCQRYGFSELDVNAQLLSWLNTEGEMLKIDYIELRRTLIDTQFWNRNSTGTSYQRLTLTEEHVAQHILSILESIDIHAFIQQAKIEHAHDIHERMLKFNAI